MRFGLGVVGLSLLSGSDRYGKECADLDGDGVFTSCKQYDETFPSPDCDDTEGSVFAVANWESCDRCVDADGDGAYAGCDQYVDGEQGLLEDTDDAAFDIVILLEGSRAEALASSLVQYRCDLMSQGLFSVVKTWDTGSAAELRGVLQEAHETYTIQGAFMVGDLPAAWYEQEAHGRFEQFPTDVFL